MNDLQKQRNVQKETENFLVEGPSYGIAGHASVVRADVEWFADHLKNYLSEVEFRGICNEVPPLESGAYSTFVNENSLGKVERIFLAAVLAFSWKHKDLLRDIQNGKNAGEVQLRLRRLERLGVIYKNQSNKIALTALAVARLIAGEDSEMVEECLFILQNSMLIKEGVVIADSKDEKGFFYEKELRMDPAYFYHLLWGTPFRIDQTENFKARLIESDLSFDDLMLDEKCKSELQILIDYIRNYKIFHESADVKQLKKGFVALFHGPPGTGKTLTATTIGHETGLPTYRIDISQIISKYIGETEKNLEAVFRKLENKDCILFFDEADALFGKRSEITEAKDRYANQEVSYLLQRIEELDFIVILATNFINNMDPAFRRRINSYIKMDPPEEETRIRLWEYYFPAKEYQVSPENLIEEAARKYAITGANIHNVIKHACNKARANGDFLVTNQILIDFLSKEYYKEGRNFNQPDKYDWARMKDFR
jgi:AAA+ superfamily predicted ATPase